MPATPAQVEERKDKVIAIAERIIAEDGVSALSARRVSADAGFSVGMIYANFGDLDGVVLAANSRFIARLDAALADVSSRGGTVTDRYLILAKTYLHFGLANRRQWAALFEHRMGNGKPLPHWHLEEHLRMFRHIAEPLGELAPGLDEKSRNALARSIYSAVHGVVSLSVETRLGQVPVPEIEKQLEIVVKSLVIGLETVLGPLPSLGM